MKKARALLVAAAAVAGLVAFAGPAQADPPNAVPGTSFPDDPLQADTDTTDGYCKDFAVKVNYLSNQLVRRSTTDSEGVTSTRISGWAKAVVTNLTSGKMLEFKISGPGLITSFPDGAFNLDLGGANLLWTTVDNSFRYSDGTTVPQLAYTTGRVHVEVLANGHTEVYELNGNGGAPTDVCALLAS
jgi:hypothetical protein